MMDIWQILQTEPTTDKKVIKNAYATRSRKVHPEEKPEEFSQLYQAYQSALLYAKGAERQVSGEEGHRDTSLLSQEKSGDGKTEPMETVNSDVYRYFWKKEESLKEKLERFQERWEDITKWYGSNPAKECWGEYIRSDEFQEIRWNPQVLELMVGKIDKLYYFYESALVLWDAYGFKEEDHLDYHGDVQRLFEALLPAYEKRRSKELEEQQRLAEIKAREIQEAKARKALKLAFLIFCVVAPFFIYFKLTGERRFVSASMERMYPADSFTRPEKIEELSGDSAVYSFNSKNHPEIQVRAVVKPDHIYEYKLLEDYGQQILQYYAEPYGLKCVRMDTFDFDEYVVFYSGIEDVGGVCDSLIKILNEQGDKELSFLDSVGICWKDALYPEIMVGGGAQDRPPAQVYSLDELPGKEALRQSVEEAFVDYMYNYEAWNLTPEQQAAYGPDYVARGRAKRVAEGGGPWSSDYYIERIEQELDLYIPIYEKIMHSGYSLPGISYQTYNVESDIYITVGNAYQLLKAGGQDITLAAYKKGFTVKAEGIHLNFGIIPEMKLDRVMNLVKEPGMVIELPSEVLENVSGMIESIPEE